MDYTKEKIPDNWPAPKTVGDLKKALANFDDNLPVKLYTEFEIAHQDSLREICSTVSYKDGVKEKGKVSEVILMGMERLCPEYRRANKVTDP